MGENRIIEPIAGGREHTGNQDNSNALGVTLNHNSCSSDAPLKRQKCSTLKDIHLNPLLSHICTFSLEQMGHTSWTRDSKNIDLPLHIDHIIAS